MNNHSLHIQSGAAVVLIAILLSACGQPAQLSPLATRLPAGGAISVSTPFQAGPTAMVEKTCTLEGCGPTIVIKLSGAVPTDFTLQAKSLDGNSAKAHCINGQNSSSADFTSLPFQPVCSAGQVSFTGFSPQTVTIEVTWGSQSMTMVAAPVYETLLPNGPGCDPTCQVGTVSLNFK
jgi:hypothetical protein